MKKKPHKILCTTLGQILPVLVFLVFAIMLPAQASSQAAQIEKAPTSASHMSASRISLSFSLQEWGNEFGTGFQITSPGFGMKKLRSGLVALYYGSKMPIGRPSMRFDWGLWGRLS